MSSAPLRASLAQRELSPRFDAVRRETLRLCEPLSPEDCQVQSMEDASPTKWHLAHTSWFFETFVLGVAESSYQPFHPDFRVLFNSYYNAVGDQHARPERGLLTRPDLEEILAYRAHVDLRMQELLQKSGALPEALLPSVALGLHHEQQHQELILTDAKHMLGRNPLRPAYRKAPAPAKPDAGAPVLAWRHHEAGAREIGADAADFCFDNELPRHLALVDAFELATRPSTNGEFLDFMRDGGYTRPELWLSDGWATAQSEHWSAPLYWEQRDDRWRQLTLGGLQEVQRAAPVCHLSYYEADAFARWSQARLPSEAEWETAARDAPVEGNFVESSALHPLPARAGGGWAKGLQQLFGDVWEWTRSPYAPYPRYAPGPGALGEYNGKFMCNQMVLRGGSCATAHSHVRATYRNFFPPNARWQFSGVRLARDAAAG